MTYFTIKEIKEANKAIGHHFFDPETMRFFRSRILSRVYAGRYFITSEKKCFDDNRRVYSIRVADETGKIDTVEDGFATAELAKKALKRLIDSENEG